MSAGPGPRRRARECALQVLYALDVGAREPEGRPAAPVPPPTPRDAEQALQRFWRELAEETDREPEIATYTEELVRRTVDNLAEIDALVQRASKNWRLDRMARVDRNILRLATCELRLGREVPTRVVINEAIEVAKRFGAHETPAFVNGLLDRIAHDVRPGEEA